MFNIQISNNYNNSDFFQNLPLDLLTIVFSEVLFSEKQRTICSVSKLFYHNVKFHDVSKAKATGIIEKNESIDQGYASIKKLMIEPQSYPTCKKPIYYLTILLLKIKETTEIIECQKISSGFKCLIDLGAPLNLKDQYKRKPLTICCELALDCVKQHKIEVYLDLVNYMLEAGDDVNEFAMPAPPLNIIIHHPLTTNESVATARRLMILLFKYRADLNKMYNESDDHGYKGSPSKLALTKPSIQQMINSSNSPRILPKTKKSNFSLINFFR